MSFLDALLKEAEETNLAAVAGPGRSSWAMECIEQKGWDKLAKSSQGPVARVLIQQTRQSMTEERALEVEKTEIRVSGQVMILGEFYNCGMFPMRHSQIGGRRWKIWAGC